MSVAPSLHAGATSESSDLTWLAFESSAEHRLGSFSPTEMLPQQEFPTSNFCKITDQKGFSSWLPRKNDEGFANLDDFTTLQIPFLWDSTFHLSHQYPLDPHMTHMMSSSEHPSSNTLNVKPKICNTSFEGNSLLSPTKVSNISLETESLETEENTLYAQSNLQHPTSQSLELCHFPLSSSSNVHARESFDQSTLIKKEQPLFYSSFEVPPHVDKGCRSYQTGIQHPPCFQKTQQRTYLCSNGCNQPMKCSSASPQQNVPVIGMDSSSTSAQEPATYIFSSPSRAALPRIRVPLLPFANDGAKRNEQRKRISTACNVCRRRKLRCDRNRPCRHCEKRNARCIYAKQS